MLTQRVQKEVMENKVMLKKKRKKFQIDLMTQLIKKLIHGQIKYLEGFLMINKKNIHLFLGVLIAGSFFVGCGSSGGDCVVSDSSKITFDKVSYYVPDDVTLIESNLSNTKMMKTGETEEIVAFVQQVGTTSGSSKSYKTIQKGVESAFSQISSTTTGSIDSLSLLSSQNFTQPYGFTLAHYKLQTNQEIEPLTLAKEIVTILSGEKTDGIPIASSTATIDTLFRLILLYGEYESSSFYIAVVVPEKSYTQYETQSKHIVNAARITPKASTPTTITNSFTQSNSSQKADFLFVVDDSGSMFDNQNALSQASDDFSKEMQGSGIAYRSAVITTGNGATSSSNGHTYRVLRSKGIIENNATLLRDALVVGTYGSGTETGIFNAEQSLQSVALGDSRDGAITIAGMPQSGATLSVIIISDEDSQYLSRAGREFNITKNLFTDRNISVYSIIQPDFSYQSTGVFDQSNRNQYDDLSLVTHGIYTDINNKNSNGDLDFSTIMKQIAQDAGGRASQFTLEHSAIAIISVKVNANLLNESTTDGYTYLQSSQAIVFHGNSIPVANATIEVNYTYTP